MSAAAAAALTDADKLVANDIDSLAGSLSAGFSFDGFDKDMTALKADLATTIADAATAKAEGKSDLSACSDAGAAQADAGGVEADAGGIEADAGGAQSTIDALAGQATNLQNAYAKATEAYQQQGLTVPAAEGASVADLLKKADATAKTWKAKAADYVASAHELAKQATAAANAAAKAVC